MALSDSKRMQVAAPRRRATSQRGKAWSDSQKMEAVKAYMVLGSVKLVSGALKIPFDTLKVWKTSEWWKELEGELRVQDDLQLSTRLQKIVTKSYDVIEDRLEHGDFVYDQKTGTMRRKPVAMKDAHRVAVDLMEKRDVLVERHMDGNSVTKDKIEETLADLAKNFAKIAATINETKRPVEVTDVVFGKDRNDAEEES